MIINNIHISDLKNVLSRGKIIKKKRERFVVKNSNKYYKIWVPNWTQGNITKYAVDKNFYSDKNASSLVSLIYDESGQRGYITNSGESLENKGWNYLNNKTSLKQRLEFMLSLLENAEFSNGIFVDLAPSNIVLIDNNISLIDFDSFNSFKLIFENKKEWYETFSLDAWWKPHETALRDVNKFYKEYFHTCLNYAVNFNFKSKKDILKLYEICKSFQ